jgi:predicted acetyltransferase
MSVQISVAASEERVSIDEMMEPYLSSLGGKGPYPHLDRYWRDPAHYPFLIRQRGQVVGFALVDQLDHEPTYELVEFYVADAFKRQGLGREAARMLFDSLVGRWLVAVRSDNCSGQAFWASFFKDNSSVTRAKVQAPEGIAYNFRSTASEA